MGGAPASLDTPVSGQSLYQSVLMSKPSDRHCWEVGELVHARFDREVGVLATKEFRVNSNEVMYASAISPAMLSDAQIATPAHSDPLKT